MYRGVVTDGYKHPCFLAQQDVVICSYETLQSELHFIDLSKQSRKFLDVLIEKLKDRFVDQKNSK